MRFRRPMTAVAVATALATVLSACSGSTSGEGSGSGATVLNIGMPNGPQTENNNPFLSTSAAASIGYRWQIYEPLLMWNPTKPAEDAKPWLATGAEWAEDYKSVVVTVRDDATWSDGEELTAEDVAFTYNLLKGNEALNVNATQYADVTADGNDVTMTFDSSQFVSQNKILASQPIVPEHLWKDIADPATDPIKTPVGSGPYTLKTFTPQTTTLDVRPDGYWQDLPEVKELRFTSYTDNNAQTTALVNGASEWSFVFIPNVEDVFVAKDPENYQSWAPPVLAIHGLYINTTKKPFDDAELRKAMNLAINRADIFTQAESAYFHPELTSPTGIPTPAGDEYISDEFKDQQHEVDVEAAKTMLTDAGYSYSGDTLQGPDGKPVTLTLTDPSGWSDYQTSLEIIRDNLSEIGITAQVDKANQDAWFENVEKGDFDATIRWTNLGATPYDSYQTVMDGALLKPIGTASPQGNFGRFDNPEATEALNTYANAADDDARTAAMDTLQQIFVDEMPMIPIGADNQGGAYSAKNWTGWPDDSDPYAGAQPTQPYALDVVLNLEPA